MQINTGQYLLRGGQFTCKRCHSTEGGAREVVKVVPQSLQDTEAAPDEWAATRQPGLQRELRDLLRVKPKERKKRLRALQLELHPDKQVPDRRKYAQPLFLLVQAEWEATEA